MDGNVYSLWKIYITGNILDQKANHHWNLVSYNHIYCAKLLVTTIHSQTPPSWNAQKHVWNTLNGILHRGQKYAKHGKLYMAFSKSTAAYNQIPKLQAFTVKPVPSKRQRRNKDNVMPEPLICHATTHTTQPKLHNPSCHYTISHATELWWWGKKEFKRISVLVFNMSTMQVMSWWVPIRR